MNEADEAARALRKLQELTNKYSNLEMDADELNQSISERINATEELKDIIAKATKAREDRENRRV